MAQGAVIRPTQGVCVRGHRMVKPVVAVTTTGLMLTYLASKSRYEEGVVFCVLAFMATVVFVAACFLADASLRRNTFYRLDDDGLGVYRDGVLVRTIAREHLRDIRPDWRDPDGVGSASLPMSDGALPVFGTNMLENYLPAWEADHRLELVRDVDATCAGLRRWARG